MTSSIGSRYDALDHADSRSSGTALSGEASRQSANHNVQIETTSHIGHAFTRNVL
jgi:hypothetical protein